MYTTKIDEFTPTRVAVIGGGAAGMMAAVSAARLGADVTLYEKNDRLGKKLRITGKGRCNVTNDCPVQEFLSNVPTNPRFLYTALSRFSVEDTKEFFESAGVPLKVERGNRVFPVSDKAADIVSAMRAQCDCAGVKTVFRKVTGIAVSSQEFADLLLALTQFLQCYHQLIRFAKMDQSIGICLHSLLIMYLVHWYCPPILCEDRNPQTVL
jgi:predicted Rossmann fold flavoprotein